MFLRSLCCRHMLMQSNLGKYLHNKKFARRVLIKTGFLELNILRTTLQNIPHESSKGDLLFLV